jgi:hypothetical protein
LPLSVWPSMTSCHWDESSRLGFSGTQSHKLHLSKRSFPSRVPLCRIRNRSPTCPFFESCGSHHDAQDYTANGPTAVGFKTGGVVAPTTC